MNPVAKLCVASLWCALLLVVLSPSSGSAQVLPDTFSCMTTINGSFFNLSSLTGTQITGQSADQYWTFYLDMCTVAPACRRDGAMACQEPTGNPGTIYDTAFPNDDIASHYWTELNNGALGGIQLDAYGSGLYCQYEGDERKTVVQIWCDPTIVSVPLTMSGPVVEGPSCTYTMQINHTSGCALPLPPTSPPATSPPVCSSSTDQTVVTGAGIGVGIVIGCVVTAVVGIGFIYVKRLGAPPAGTTGKWNKFDDDKAINMSTLPETTSREETNTN